MALLGLGFSKRRREKLERGSVCGLTVPVKGDVHHGCFLLRRRCRFPSSVLLYSAPATTGSFCFA